LALLPQPVESNLSIDALPAIQGIQPFCNLLADFLESKGSELILLFQKPERFTNDFACRVVSATPDFFGDQFLQFGS
jgi:hypothetical protein